MSVILLNSVSFYWVKSVTWVTGPHSSWNNPLFVLKFDIGRAPRQAVHEPMTQAVTTELVGIVGVKPQGHDILHVPKTFFNASLQVRKMLKDSVTRHLFNEVDHGFAEFLT